MTIIVPDRGLKHTCAGCSTRFYDLKKSPAACPKCGQKVPIRIMKPRKRRTKEVMEPGSNLETSHFKVTTGKPSKNVMWKT